MNRQHDIGAFRQWGGPTALALLSLFGLLSALLGGGGVWWWLSWAALATPLALILAFGPLRRVRAALRG